MTSFVRWDETAEKCSLVSILWKVMNVNNFILLQVLVFLLHTWVLLTISVSSFNPTQRFFLLPICLCRFQICSIPTLCLYQLLPSTIIPAQLRCLAASGSLRNSVRVHDCGFVCLVLCLAIYVFFSFFPFRMSSAYSFSISLIFNDLIIFVR